MTEILQPDAALLAILAPCMDNYDVGETSAEWPNNILSTKTVIYQDGTIAKAGDVISHSIDAVELQLCQQLSANIAEIMQDVEVGMGSESGDVFQPFYIVKNTPAQTINATLIEHYFAQSIFPLATILVEPLQKDTQWWTAVEQDGEESPTEYFTPWLNMLNWFQQQHDFIDVAFVSIGDCELLQEIDQEDYPDGTVITGCVLPRLALGLTAKGSLVGLFGYVVHS